MNGLRAQLLKPGVSVADFAALTTQVHAVELDIGVLEGAVIALDDRIDIIEAQQITDDARLDAIELNYPRGRLFVPTINTAAVLNNLTAGAGETGMFTDAGSPVANRLYRITAKIGFITKNTNAGNITIRVKIGATTYGTWVLSAITAGLGMTCIVVSEPTALPAGAQTFIVTVQTNTDTCTATNVGNGGGWILVEDIGHT